MTGPTQDETFSLTIGASRLGHGPPELRTALVFPAANPIFKREAETLVWQLQFAPGQTGVVKMYRRRGLWRRLRGRVLPLRVRREFAALCILAAGGVPCSRPWLWGWGWAPEHGHFELLLTREIAGAVSLKQHFTAGGPPLCSDDWQPLFNALRRMHECGVYHGALWPKNILLTRAADGACQFHLIDLARAVRFPGNIRGTTMARFDLLSLLHSLARTSPGFDAEALLLRHGYAPAEATRIADQSRRYRSSRHLRNRLALTFQLRALVARR